MTDAARLAAVLIRLVACGLVARVMIGIVIQAGMLVASPGPASDPPVSPGFALLATLGYALYLLPGIPLFRHARRIGTWVARGLD